MKHVGKGCTRPNVPSRTLEARATRQTTLENQGIHSITEGTDRDPAAVLAVPAVLVVPEAVVAAPAVVVAVRAAAVAVPVAVVEGQIPRGAFPTAAGSVGFTPAVIATQKIAYPLAKSTRIHRETQLHPPLMKDSGT